MEKDRLAGLYAQKGEIVTELEMLQAQLQRVNQQIIQARNALADQLEPEEKTAKGDS